MYESVRWRATSCRERCISRALTVEDDRRVGADSVPELLYPEKDVSEGRMVCKQLNLPGTIEQNVVLYHIHFISP